MNERKLLVGDDSPASDASSTDISKLNPMDALNRRDIELIKRSLNSMHKDCAELRETIVALHARQSNVPSKGFFLGLGAVSLILAAGVVIGMPQIDATLHRSPAVANLVDSGVTR